MGRKGKIEEAGLVELVAEKWDGGKKTIIYVTDEVNNWLKENGFKITVSREGIRRVIRNQEQQLSAVRQGMENAKAMASVLKDAPGTEISEAIIMQMSYLIAKELQNIGDLSWEDPTEMVIAATKLANAHKNLSAYRTQAITALEKAKSKIKSELRRAIHSDSELLERLNKIVDEAKVA
jgi:hypothetical protein